MSQDKPFYLVWRPGGANPTYRHPDHGSALQEAQRLARLNPGMTFFVLIASDSFKRTDTEHRVLFDPTHDDVPF
ncbi:hypothetical protein EIK56_24205 [Sphingomonas sp. C8-2]|nr:hypothetical protein EIK56_24205 [Sphingomonas sp. C8-2]